MRVQIKQTDESRVSTITLTDDSELTVALEASTTYFVDITFTFIGGATPDIKWAYVYTGTLTNALTFEGARDASTTASGGSGDNFGPPVNATGSNFTTPVVRAVGGNDTAGTVGGGHIRGVIITNSSGNLKLQWAQNNSSVTSVTVQKGSYIAFAKQTDMDGTLTVKGSNTNRASTTTLAADPDLQFTTKANSKYICEMLAVNQSASSLGDFKWALHDASVTQTLGHVTNVELENNNVFSTSSDAAIHGQFRTAAWLTTPTTGAFGTSTLSFYNQTHIHWSQVQGGSDNTLAYEWAQNASHPTNVTVIAPSWLLYEEVFQ